jgi:hypothetical protein
VPAGNSSYLSSFIFLHTTAVFPVFESIFVVTGMQAQVTVLAFSSFTTTQCSINSADDGGIWLFRGFTSGGGGGVGCGGGAGGFFAAQPASNKIATSQILFISRSVRFLKKAK